MIPSFGLYPSASLFVRFLGVLVFLTLALTSRAESAPQLSDNSVDVLVIDRVLASVRPDQKIVDFGDIGMPISQLKAIRDRLAAAPVSAQHDGQDVQPDFAFLPSIPSAWPNGNVYYRFDPTQVSNNTITPNKMRAFRHAVGEWAACANLHFFEFTSNPPAHYITVQYDPNRAGGKFIYGGTEEFVQLGPNDWTHAIICHEVGHSLGLFHEHQRVDRDTYVIIFWNNIASADQPNFTKLSNNSQNYGPYDFYSVMHYTRNFLAIDPAHDTIEPQPAYNQFLNVMGYNRPGADRTLSKLDRAGMARLYGNPSILPSPVVTNTNDSGLGSLRAALGYAFDRSTDTPPVPTTISFRIPVSDPGFDGKAFTIKPTDIMFAPGAGTTIDGTTQTAFTGGTNPSGPEIVISGSLLAQQGISAPGLILREANCTMKGLVINGFNQQGVLITGIGATGNVVSGCYIGTDATGATPVSNALSGIEISGSAHGNTIGGTAPATRNVISGNGAQGITINGSGTNLNIVNGNFIGLDASGITKVGNGLSGVEISGGAQANTIGGTAVGSGNFISGNTKSGIAISGSGTNGNVIQGNTIGLSASGAMVANSLQGIAILGGADSNMIGGSAIGAANIIWGNMQEGIALFDPTTLGNMMSQNSISNNGALGIAFYNNSNNQQSSPSLSSAILSTVTNPGGTDVSGTLNSTPNTTFRAEFFANQVANPGGQYFIGATNIVTNGAGGVSFTASLPAAVPPGYVITADVTDPNGNTSQFSSAQTVTAADSDGDGIPDNWMIAHFGHATGQASDRSRASDDANGTGMTNLQKFLAGLDPNNPKSVFRISSMAPNLGNIQISFSTVSGKTYRLDYCNDLVAGNWSTLVDGIFTATGTSIQISDPSAAALGKRFYRVCVEP